MKEYLKFRKSFTLIELLVVIAIIGLLSSVILVNLSGPRQRAKITKSLEFSQSVQHAIGSEAVGVWNFDDCSAKDLSGYGNNGTINGATCVDDTPYKVVGSGQGKNALSFDGGDDYVDAGNGASLQIGTGNFSVSFWVNTTQTGINRDIIAKQLQIPPYVGWLIRLNSAANTGKISFRYSVVGTLNQEIRSNTIINDGKWHHVLCKFDTNTTYIYIDGKFENSGIVTTGSLDSAYSLKFGYGLDYFNGLIDEVRIYATALTIGEIQDLYLAGLEKYQQLTIK